MTNTLLRLLGHARCRGATGVVSSVFRQHRVARPVRVK